jgi:hypothetical protein
MLFSYENIKNIPVVTLPFSHSAILDSLCNDGVFFMKTCCRCKTQKDFPFFIKCKSRKDGYHPVCKACSKIYSDLYKQKNREKIRKAGKLYYNANKEKIQAYRENNREKSREYFKSRYVEKGEILRAYKNSPRARLVRNANQRRRMETLHNRLKRNCGVRICHALSRNVKSARTVELIGCTIDELKIYLSSLFQERMSWENYGRHGWHVDHIKPCAKFDLSDPVQQKICFHYSNLQPLWEIDNIRKKDKYKVEC